jgi:hypothetical protein
VSEVEKAWDQWSRAVGEEQQAYEAWTNARHAADDALEYVRQLRNKADREYVPPMVDAATVAPRITSKLP